MAAGIDTTRQRLWPGILLGVLVALLLVLPGHRWSDSFEAVTYDVRFEVRDPLDTGEEVMVVGIDSEDLRWLGQWPWWRHDWADLLEPMAASPEIRPKAIVFDVLFIEPQGARLEQHIREVEGMGGEGSVAAAFLRDVQEFNRWSDLTFGETIEQLGDVDLAAYFNLSPTAALPGGKVSGVRETNRIPAGSIHESIPQAVDLEIPIPELLAGCHGIGFVNVLKDPDGVIRRSWTFLQHDGYLYPSLFMLAVCHKLGVDVRDVDVIPGRYVSIPVSPEPIEIPIDRRGAMAINFRGREAFRHAPHAISCRDFALAVGRYGGRIPQDTGSESFVDPRFLRDKVLLFGMFAEGGPEDVGVVPGAENYPLVSYHANAVDNILTGDFLRPHPALYRPIEILLIIFFAIAVATSVRYLSPARGALTSIVFAVLYWAVGFQAFSVFRWDLPLFRPTLAILLAFSANVLFYFLVERRARQRTVRFLSSYVSPDVVKRLLESEQELQFGGQRAHITVLFSDIRGFTALSERISPEEVVELLNEYFGEMTKIIFDHEGTLDKFMGDAIMVFFGHPERREDDALRAVRTALAMQERMRRLQTRWEVEEKESIGVGIGISTGDVVVGNVGTSEKAEYTAIGNDVNLAFRLQALAEAGEILIGETTWRELDGCVEVKQQEPVRVKGKSEPVAIYRVIGMAETSREAPPADATVPAKTPQPSD
jgi:adenylate cyclase